MLKINKITSDHVIDYAAEELKKYLRMMMPEGGDVSIKYAPDATDGFRLGVMSDFGLDTSEAQDITVDDILHIDCDEQGGIIAGSNVRSVLLAVYKYLKLNGCLWIFPGKNGEVIPIQDVKPTKYHKMADMRYRGECNEGGIFQESIIASIEFAPKVGLNCFMQEKDISLSYYQKYNERRYNCDYIEPDKVTEADVLKWKRECEAEISKRGLLCHDYGHGWACKTFGLDSRSGGAKPEVPPEITPENREFMALVGGKRDLFHGIPLYTNLCMSNKKARDKMTSIVCDYAEKHSNVDYLHVWGADESNNECECPECVKKTPSDWYVLHMNEIDAEMTRRGIDMKIAIIEYSNTTFPPETEKLNNPDRFKVITARWGEIPFYTGERGNPIRKYEKNNIVLPANIEDSMEYAFAWKERLGIEAIMYDYTFHLMQYFDLPKLYISKGIHDEIKSYHKVGIEGVITDCTQRKYFPHGLGFFVYGETLFDTSVKYEELLETFFRAAYGVDWKKVLEFYEKLEELMPIEYMFRKKSANAEVGPMYNPAMAAGFRKVPELCAEMQEFINDHKMKHPVYAQSVSFRLLEIFLEYAQGIARGLALKCLGAGDEAREHYFDFVQRFGRHEHEIEMYYDHYLASMSLRFRIFWPGESEIALVV